MTVSLESTWMNTMENETDVQPSVGFREPKRVAVYSDTEVEIDPDTGEEKPKRLEDKTVQVSKIITNIPKKIVRTSVAFLVWWKNDSISG